MRLQDIIERMFGQRKRFVLYFGEPDGASFVRDFLTMVNDLAREAGLEVPQVSTDLGVALAQGFFPVVFVETKHMFPEPIAAASVMESIQKQPEVEYVYKAFWLHECVTNSLRDRIFEWLVAEGKRAAVASDPVEHLCICEMRTGEQLKYLFVGNEPNPVAATTA